MGQVNSVAGIAGFGKNHNGPARILIHQTAAHYNGELRNQVCELEIKSLTGWSTHDGYAKGAVETPAAATQKLFAG